MEPVNVKLVSVIENKGQIRDRARAMAHDARIMIEVRFQADEGASTADIWQEARDQCLRCLDNA